MCGCWGCQVLSRSSQQCQATHSNWAHSNAALNPVVLCAYKVKNLPDAPATQQQLDTLCERVKLKAVWPGLVNSEQAAATVSSCSSDEGSDEELSAAEQRLQGVLRRYEHVLLDNRLHQSLSTCQLDAQQAADPSLDLLTGFQLADGALRLVVLEGPAEGIGMAQAIAGIARWALEDQLDWQQEEQQERWLPRKVIYNPSIRYPGRLYAGLGVDLWMLKLKGTLAAIGAQPGSYASGRVHPDCIAGLECFLGQAGSAGLARLLDELRLYPTAAQLHLMDKKFGGELTKADVLGVEAEEPDSEDEEQQPGKPASLAAGATPAAQKQGGAKQPQQLSATHAAAAAAKAASAKLMALLADSSSGSSQLGAAGATGADVAAAAGAGGAGARSRKSAKSGTSRRLRRSKGGRRSRSSSRSRLHRQRQRRAAAKHHLDMDNEVYLHLRLEAQRRRQQRDFQAEYVQGLHGLECSRQQIRDSWATWNPQRAAAQQLQEAITAGTLTLQDTIKARLETSTPLPPVPGTLAAPEALSRGWYPHQAPFLWPAPRDPATYNTHPLKPSEYRVQELGEPFDGEQGLGAWSQQLAAAAAGHTFDSLVRPSPTGLFTHDPAFWQTLHMGGDGWEEQQAAAAAAAKAEWAAKVVVKDTAIHVVPGTGDRASAQADKYGNLLKGPPLKKGLKAAHVPSAPVSMHSQVPWQAPPPAAAAAAAVGTSPSAAGSIGAVLKPWLTSAEKSKWVGPKDFDAVGIRSRSVVAKPGLNDAANASLHDSYYVSED
ncbi:hypothetical protein OEZ85_012330 [Tetradesmus obliquus]|uniref:Uncharacterized protein n=1 Tax=Tetradesmus obliquus TaxID=3088 RepID=A0ABY8TT04_TETOB|nr:hypothetical protein OEZ85_012330 [Tetradesmus obliquus]